MSKTAPAIYVAPSLGDFYSGQQIGDAEWDTLIEALHTTWRYRGAMVCGMIFNPPFETTSTTYSQNNEATDLQDLQRYGGASRLLRDGASNVQVTLAVYGKNITVKLTATALDTNTSLGSVEVSAGGSEEWNDDSITITLANAGEGGSASNPKRHIAYKVEAKVSSGTGELYGFEVHESILSASALP